MPTPTKDEVVRYELAQRAIKIYTKLIEYPEWKFFKEKAIEDIRDLKRQIVAETEFTLILRLQGQIMAAERFVGFPEYEIRDAKEFVVMFDKAYKKQKKEA